MSFRKRSVPLSSRSTASSAANDTEQQPPSYFSSSSSSSSPSSTPGVRASPSDGRPTISTGTPSLDALLAGHAGLPLGTSLLITESGTTDYAGLVCRYFGAEGVVQAEAQAQAQAGAGKTSSGDIQKVVHVVGVGEAWGRELPGVVGVVGADDVDPDKESRRGKGVDKAAQERMKIAWRYEGLRAGGGRKGASTTSSAATEASPTAPSSTTPAFCHAYDLTKRLSIPSPSPLNFIPPPAPNPGNQSPYMPILQTLQDVLTSTPPTTVHRLLIPNLLSPALYPSHACLPNLLLPFLHAIRALLRQYPTRLAALITLPLELYPRATALVRWIELLADGVVELTPFPHHVGAGAGPPNGATSGAATAQEEQPQGLVKVHRLPVFHERGGGAFDRGDDLAFTVSRKRFAIKPFSLPPVEGDMEAQQQDPHQVGAAESADGRDGEKGGGGKVVADAASIEF